MSFSRDLLVYFNIYKPSCKMYKNNVCNNLKLDASIQQPKGLAARRAERECLDLSDALRNSKYFLVLCSGKGSLTWRRFSIQSVVYVTSQRCAGAAETAYFLRNSFPSEIITVLINSLAALSVVCVYSPVLAAP